MKHTIEKLGGRQESSSVMVASNSGDGIHKKLIVVVHYDGGGFSLVEFVVQDHGEPESFSTFDAAVESYNEKP